MPNQTNLEKCQKRVRGLLATFQTYKLKFKNEVDFAVASPSAQALAHLKDYSNTLRDHDALVTAEFQYLAAEEPDQAQRDLDVAQSVDYVKQSGIISGLLLDQIARLERHMRPAAAPAAPPAPGRGAGAGAAVPHFKVDRDLKPDKLGSDANPEEVRSWLDQFRAYHSTSKMEILSVPNQQAYFFACLEQELRTYVKGQVSDSTTIWGVGGCAEILDERFQQLYPKFTRRLAFFGLHQAKDQTFADFYAALRRKGNEAVLAGITTDDIYVFRLIQGCTDLKLREELTKLRAPTLKTLLEEATAWEVSKRDNKSLISSAQTFAAAAAMQPKKVDGQPKCGNCGRRGHKSGDTCPAKNGTCNKCNKKGHYANVCRQKSEDKEKTGDARGRSSKKGRDTPAASRSRSVSPLPKDTVAHVYHLSRGGITPRVTLELMDGDRVAVTFAALPDTGASHTLISRDLVANTGLTPVDEPGIPTLFSASGHAMVIDGVLRVPVVCPEYGSTYLAEMLVTPNLTGELLICLGDLPAIGLLHPDWPRQAPAQALQVSCPWSAADVQKEFQDVLVDSLGDARGGIRGEPMHIELKTEETIKPIQIYTTRQVPIHYHKAYKKLIKELLSAGVLVRELKSTKWTSRAHFVPKPVPVGADIKLRLVTDYRELNKAVLRPTHPFPSAPDLMRRLKPDSRYFCKLDAVHGYFQIPLDEPSSLLTTFLLPCGRYRYTCAPMGLKSSSDESTELI